MIRKSAVMIVAAARRRGGAVEVFVITALQHRRRISEILPSSVSMFWYQWMNGTRRPMIIVHTVTSINRRDYMIAWNLECEWCARSLPSTWSTRHLTDKNRYRSSTFCRNLSERQTPRKYMRCCSLAFLRIHDRPHPWRLCSPGSVTFRSTRLTSERRREESSMDRNFTTQQ